MGIVYIYHYQLIHVLYVGLSLACASTCNLLLMRNSELSTGIEVEDHNGNVIGKSKVAAKKVKKKLCINK